jgi:hypothetical protein
MTNVVSLERAAARRGVLLNHGDLLMANNKNVLMLINLPLVPRQPPARVLVLLADQQRNSARLILSDVGGSPQSDYTVLGQGVPLEFGPESVSEITLFLGRHQEQTAALVAGGGVRHGNLTLARAVHIMVGHPDTAPSDALAQAIEISHSCAAWAQGVASLARELAHG